MPPDIVSRRERLDHGAVEDRLIQCRRGIDQGRGPGHRQGFRDAAHLQGRIHTGRHVGIDHDLLAHDGAEALQFDANPVHAGNQARELIHAPVVGDRRLIATDRPRIDQRDRHAWKDDPGAILRGPADRPGSTLRPRVRRHALQAARIAK